MPRDIERIGIIFVHGIGEQRRFEHLEDHLRPLIDALLKRKQKHGSQVTVEILGAASAVLHAEQDTWSANPDPAVRAIVKENGTEKQLFFHEVWWADVNEPYSFWKQVRFWWWGLSLWATPGKYDSTLAGRGAMDMPKFEGWHWRDDLTMRARLFFVSNIFAVAAFSLGAIVFLAKRLVGLNAPSPVRVFVNYIGAVKLYSQRRRFDGGFLDAYNEPPRVSIRRRMVRTLADAACAGYDRWYVLAHSLGSVVAFNGLMENAHALPNYLDETRWNRLNNCGAGAPLAGPARPGKDYVDEGGDMIPARPVWLPEDAVVYRDRLFAKFRGLLTYGSPLDKFAGLWPARVPINKGEKAFDGAEWINVYDPTDPVAAPLDAFGNKTRHAATLYPINYGYRASPVLLYSHLRYMHDADGRTKLADVAADWILTAGKFSPPVGASRSPWYLPGTFPDFGRGLLALTSWAAVYVTLLWLGVLNLLALPIWEKIVEWSDAFAAELWPKVESFWQADPVLHAGRPIGRAAAGIVSQSLGVIGAVFSTLLDGLKLLSGMVMPDLITNLLDAPMFKLAFYVAVFTAVVGMISRLFWQRDDDDLRRTPHKNASNRLAKSAA